MPDEPKRMEPGAIFERRRFVRVEGTFVVSYTDIGTAQPKSDITQTKNISLGGMLFTTDKRFAPGTMLRVRLRLPDSTDYISIKAEVIESKEIAKDVMYNTRARFVGVREDDKDFIRKIVEYNLKKK
jgi:c-di-GMP-binding flagellar brake protein YcgR